MTRVIYPIVCPECHLRFQPHDAGRFCSIECRFWNKVERTGACWMWRSGVNEMGYGVFGWPGSPVGRLAHRISYFWHAGEIPAGMVIDHACRNPACVRPDHLQVTTNKRNSENRSGANAGNLSGVRNVSWVRSSNTWAVRVTHRGKVHSGGSFESLAEAAEAAKALRLRLFSNNLSDRTSA